MVRENLRPLGDSEGNKAYNITSICVETRHRLVEIQLEDLDEVFRFRIGIYCDFTDSGSQKFPLFSDEFQIKKNLT